MNNETATLQVGLTMLQALNLKMLVEDRIREIDKHAEEFPHLPMKDSITYESYCDMLAKLEEVTPDA